MQRAELIEKLAEKMYNHRHRNITYLPFADAPDFVRRYWLRFATIALNSLVVDEERVIKHICDIGVDIELSHGIEALASTIVNDGEVIRCRKDTND